MIMPGAITFAFVVILLTCDGFCSALTTNVGRRLMSSAIAPPITLISSTAINMATDDDQSSSSPSPSTYSQPDNVVANNAAAAAEDFPAIILSPVVEALDLTYVTKGPIGGNDFKVIREGEPLPEELTDENLIQILWRRSNVTDLEVNTLVWKCLGYRFGADETEEWTAPDVFPKWKERYPRPPDLIGMQRIYSKAIDGENLKNNQRLTISVPVENKQSLKMFLKPLGFTGYKVSELTPNLTRRAQCTNWLLYYREELFGYTLDELREKRRLKKEKEAEEERKRVENNEEKKMETTREGGLLIRR